MENKKRYIYTLFTTIADRYDFINTLLSFNRDSYWRKYATSKVTPHLGDRVLDVATGTGKLALELAKQDMTRKVVGIDFCPGMLTKAKTKLKRTPFSRNVDFILADAHYLPFPNGSFDAAFTSFALRDFYNLPRSLREMVRVVRKGGEIICLELSLPPSKLFRLLYNFYLNIIAPLIIRLLATNKEAYSQYLPQSIKEFPPPEKMTQIMEEVGIKDIKIHRLTQGIAIIYVGKKG